MTTELETSFEWVKAAILSCTNDWHLRCCSTLIDLFQQKYPAAMVKLGELIRHHNAKEAQIMV